MDRKMIFGWANLLCENIEDSRNETDLVREEGVGSLGFTIPDERGNGINGIISPDIFQNREGSTEDLFNGDFRCNVTDTTRILTRFPQVPKNMIPDQTTFLFFLCIHGSLEKKRMVDYINTMCSDALGSKIDPKDVNYVGNYPMREGQNKRYDLYLYALPSKNRDVQKAFNTIRDSYRDEILRVQYGDKQHLMTFFKTNPSLGNKLEDGKNYLMMLAVKGTLNPRKQLKVADAINASVEIFDKDELEEKDIRKLGNIQVTKKENGDKLEFDVFVAEAN